MRHPRAALRRAVNDTFRSTPSRRGPRQTRPGSTSRTGAGLDCPVIASLVLMAVAALAVATAATALLRPTNLLASWATTHSVTTYAETSSRISYGGELTTAGYAAYLGGRARIEPFGASASTHVHWFGDLGIGTDRANPRVGQDLPGWPAPADREYPRQPVQPHPGLVHDDVYDDGAPDARDRRRWYERPSDGRDRRDRGAHQADRRNVADGDLTPAAGSTPTRRRLPVPPRRRL